MFAASNERKCELPLALGEIVAAAFGSAPTGRREAGAA